MSQANLAEASDFVCTAGYISKLERETRTKKGVLPHVGDEIINRFAEILKIPRHIARAAAGLSSSAPENAASGSSGGGGVSLGEFFINYEILDPSFQSAAIKMFIPILTNLYEIQTGRLADSFPRAAGKSAAPGGVKKVPLYVAAKHYENEPEAFLRDEK